MISIQQKKSQKYFTLFIWTKHTAEYKLSSDRISFKNGLIQKIRQRRFMSEFLMNFPQTSYF